MSAVNRFAERSHWDLKRMNNSWHCEPWPPVVIHRIGNPVASFRYLNWNIFSSPSPVGKSTRFCFRYSWSFELSAVYSTMLSFINSWIFKAYHCFVRPCLTEMQILRCTKGHSMTVWRHVTFLRHVPSTNIIISSVHNTPCIWHGKPLRMTQLYP